MDEIIITLDQLRGMIGLKVRHHGMRCQIIEVLEDGPSLVLQNCEAISTIQANQFGDANRRVPQTQTIPVLTPDHTELHALFLALDLD
jgi:hypothetical protein